MIENSQEPILYFLRSSEQFIVEDILHYAARFDEENKKLADFPSINCYHELYGYKEGDIGVYVMIGSEVAGAAWVRVMQDGHGFVDNSTPELALGVKPKFRNNGVGTLLMNQLIYEVAGLYPQMSLCVRSDNPVISLYKRLGFTEIENTRRTTQDRGLEVFNMLKIFSKDERKNKFS